MPFSFGLPFNSITIGSSRKTTQIDEPDPCFIAFIGHRHALQAPLASVYLTSGLVCRKSRLIGVSCLIGVGIKSKQVPRLNKTLNVTENDGR